MNENLIVNLINANIYQREHLILSGVNLQVYKGEFVYLIGKTGSGKSSLLKTLYGALPLAEGRGEVAGFALPGLNRRTIPLLRRKLGIVFQDFNLLSDRSVEDNLRFVLDATNWKEEPKKRERMAQVLEQVDLTGQEKKMPHQLSGGEQQRVVIARALLNRPELIIADEPTGNLDERATRGVFQLIREINAGGTAVVMATHDLDLVKQTTYRTVELREGAVVFDSGVDDGEETDP